jgi:hypothetical protein
MEINFLTTEQGKTKKMVDDFRLGFIESVHER